MELKRIKKVFRNPVVYLYFGLFFCFAYFAHQLPYCHDEWRWGIASAIDNLKHGFSGYNGRYLGNLLSIAVTRSEAVKILTIAVGMLLVIWLATKVLDGVKRVDRFFVFGVTTFLFLAIPRGIFQQSYAWIAAFVNFVPPVILIFVFFSCIQNVFSDEEIHYSRLSTVLVVPLGIATQLFSEHTTVYVVLLSIFILVYVYIKRKRIYLYHVLYFVSSVAGAILMFSNSAYRHAAANTDGYKSLGNKPGESFLYTIGETYVRDLSDMLFLHNWLINLIIISLCLFLILKNREKLSRRLRAAANGSAVILSMYGVYTVCKLVYPEWRILSSRVLNALVNALFPLAFFVAVCFVVFVFVPDKNRKAKLLTLFVSAPAMAAPLLVARPFGTRCLYASYTMFLLFALQMIIYFINDYHIDVRKANLLVWSVLLMLLVYYYSIFSDIGQVNRQRIQMINDSVKTGATEIVLPTIPYSSYTWRTIPENDQWMANFKEFYHIPQSTEVKFK